MNSKEIVEKFDCPVCGAAVGEACRMKERPTIAIPIHYGRFAKARESVDNSRASLVG